MLINGKTKTGRLWLYVCDDWLARTKATTAAWFQVSPDCKCERPPAHLEELQGALQADAQGG